MPARKTRPRTESTTKIAASVDIESMGFEPLEPTSRTTKAELVEAYNDLLERFSAREAQSPPAKMEAEKRRLLASTPF